MAQCQYRRSSGSLETGVPEESAEIVFDVNPEQKPQR